MADKNTPTTKDSTPAAPVSTAPAPVDANNPAETMNREQLATAAAPGDDAVDVEVDEANEKPKTYYLKKGARHNVIVRGENLELTDEGQEVKLLSSQYKSFKDKFYTADEYELAKKQAAEALAEAETEKAAQEEADAKEAKEREAAAKKTAAPPG